jgi:predicted nucleic acid-binding protein
MLTDQIRKIQSLTLDTNVLLDLPELPKYFDFEPKGDEQNARKKRVLDSYMTAVICLSENVSVRKVGIKIVEKELGKTRWLLPVYYQIFPSSVKPDRTAKKLAETYMANAGLKPADALIVGTASANNIDVLLTWNRTDLARDSVRQKIGEINKAARMHVPFICDPTYFIDRLIGSEGKSTMSLALSPSPVPKAYRLGFYPSR